MTTPSGSHSIRSKASLGYGVDTGGFTPDTFVWELADSIMGDHSLEPDRMLFHAEVVVGAVWSGDGWPQRLSGKWDLLVDDPMRVGCYVELDLLSLAEQQYGQSFASWMRTEYEPTDILFRLAQPAAIVALTDGGSGAPEWSVRISIASLTDDQYRSIGASLRAVGGQYVDEWRRQT